MMVAAARISNGPMVSLPEDDRKAGIFELEASDPERLELQPAAEDINRDNEQQPGAKGQPHPGGKIRLDALDDGRLQHQQQSAEHHGRQRECQGAERHEHADVLRVRPLVE